MSKADFRVLLAGLLPDGQDPKKLTKEGRKEVRLAIFKLLNLMEPS